jgi:hypothetical protein
MIVTLERDQHSWFLRDHSEGQGYWLSPGALRYLRKHTDYEPDGMARVSFYTVERLWATEAFARVEKSPLADRVI